jgi:mRNA-degrading endonuclease RelE of RelBE toxin-antitoxin system
VFEIRLAKGAVADLKALSRFQRATIVEAMERRLAHAPLMRTRNQKKLPGLVPPWDQVGPVWQLRVGELRVFYDVDETRSVVVVQAIRRKGRNTTGETP